MVERCPFCGFSRLYHDVWRGEVVCPKCGSVIPQELPIRQCFSDSHNPTNNLAFGRNLGSYMSKRDLMRILRMSEAGEKDLGLRARQIRIMLSEEERRVVKTMLENTSKILKDAGYHTNKDKDAQIADVSGRIARAVAWFLYFFNRRPTREYAEAIVLYTIWLFEGREKAKHIAEKLSLAPRRKAIELVKYLHHIIVNCL